MNFQVLNDSNDPDNEEEYPSIEEIKQHIQNYKAMYRDEMYRARTESRYLLDAIARAKADLAMLEMYEEMIARST